MLTLEFRKIAALLVVLAGLYSCSGDTVINPGTAPKEDQQVVEDSSALTINLGSMKVGDCVTRRVTIPNHTKQTVVISSISSNSSAVSIETAMPLSLPPNASFEFNVVFCCQSVGVQEARIALRDQNGNVFSEIVIQAVGAGIR